MIEKLTDEQRSSWREEIDRFKNDIYPDLFAPHGFTLSEAYIAWRLNGISNLLGDTVDELRDMNAEQVDDWRKEDDDKT